MYRFRLIGLSPVEIFEEMQIVFKRKGNQICHGLTFDDEFEWTEGNYDYIKSEIQRCRQVILAGNDDANSFIFDCGNNTYWWCHITPMPRPSVTMKCRIDWNCWMEIRTDYSNVIKVDKRSFSDILYCFCENMSTGGEGWDEMLEEFIVS